VLPAIEAASGLPAAALLSLAHGAAELHAPLTAALALERLRQGSTVLPKEEWQGQTTQVGKLWVRSRGRLVQHGRVRISRPLRNSTLAELILVHDKAAVGG